MRTTCSSASAFRNGATSSRAAAPDLRAADAGDIGKFDGRGHVFARIEERRQPIEPFVGNARYADIRFGLSRRTRGASRALVNN